MIRRTLLRLTATASIIAMTLSLSNVSHAMDFNLVINTPTVATLTMNGETFKGDYAKLEAYLTVNKDRIANHTIVVNLDSIGGDLIEAMKIGRELTHSIVVVRDVCASACFYMFANAKHRIVSASAHIGVHSAVYEGPSKDKDAMGMAGTAYLAQELRELNVPDDVIMDMLVTPHSSVHWLTLDQLSRMSVKFI